jgi:hypothetical protein
MFLCAFAREFDFSGTRGLSDTEVGSITIYERQTPAESLLLSAVAMKLAMIVTWRTRAAQPAEICLR